MPRRGGAAQDGLAASLTRAASLQSYLTVRWLADPAYRADGFALYACFRCPDDMVDEHLPDEHARLAFVAQQRALLQAAVEGRTTVGSGTEESLLVGLVARELARQADRTHGGPGPAAGPDTGLLLSLRRCST